MIVKQDDVFALLSSSDCSAGFGLDSAAGSCTACTGDTFKADVADTECLALPNGTSVPASLVVAGGNTGYREYSTSVCLKLE